jgi:hypothetical protein
LSPVDTPVAESKPPETTIVVVLSKIWLQRGCALAEAKFQWSASEGLSSRRGAKPVARLQPVLNFFGNPMEILSKWYRATVPIAADYPTSRLGGGQDSARA